MTVLARTQARALTALEGPAHAISDRMGIPTGIAPLGVTAPTRLIIASGDPSRRR